MSHLKSSIFSFRDATAVAHVAASLSEVATIIKKVQRYHAAYSSLCCAPLPLSLSLPAQAILMADQWDLYNEPGVDFIKHTYAVPCA